MVRLVRGASDAQINYDDEPLVAARRWVDSGAQYLHVIDLGSAFGERDSTDVILDIAASLDVPLQVGGGLRDHERVRRLLGGGVRRVIVGTRALRDPAFLRDLVDEFGAARIVLAMDVADGRVKISGWTEESSFDLSAGMDYAVGAGVEKLLVTAIDRDGTLDGPNLELVTATLRLADAEDVDVVVAGGIGTLDHIRTVIALGHRSLEGVVVGRALYEGTVDLRQALELTSRG